MGARATKSAAGLSSAFLLLCGCAVLAGCGRKPAADVELRLAVMQHETESIRDGGTRGTTRESGTWSGREWVRVSQATIEHQGRPKELVWDDGRILVWIGEDDIVGNVTQVDRVEERGMRSLRFRLDREGQQRIKRLTERNIGRAYVVIADGEVIYIGLIKSVASGRYYYAPDFRQ